jgi:hypothetical protein
MGTANAYWRILDGQELNFYVESQRILDRETGSKWDVLGQALSGKLVGKTLTPVVAINHFWLSWAAFKPETRIYQP